MKKITLLALAAALVCGLLVYVYLNSVRRTAEDSRQVQDIETVQVVVAVQEIPRYTDITEEMVTLRDFPADYVPDTAAKSLDDVLGLQADGTIYPDEMIFTTGLATGEELGSTMSSRIPDGMRAMSIEVSTAQGVDGYLEVGDYVDVLLYLSDQDTGSEDGTEEDAYTSNDTDTVTTNSGIIRDVTSGVTVTVPLLEGVEIAALGPETTADDGTTQAYTEVTLFLTPEQCAALLAAKESGTMWLSLRRTGDSDSYYTGSVTFTEQMN